MTNLRPNCLVGLDNGYSMFRDKPLGPKCMCDYLFNGFRWGELVGIRARDLPNEPGVYVIRVIERGLNVESTISYLNDVLGRTKWYEFLRYVNSRLNRLRRIGDCPVIYIGSTSGLRGVGAKSSIRSRYVDLAGRRHTAFFPILALLLAGWRLDYGFKTTNSHSEAKELEERLKKEYREIHGALPALVAR